MQCTYQMQKANDWKPNAAMTEIGILEDLDWRFIVTAVSSTPNDDGRTCVEIRFSTTDAANGKKTNTTAIFGLAQFYELLHQLERARNQLQ